MENIINRIIEMDNKAKEITDQARQEKIRAEEEILKNAEKIRQQYLDDARRRIALNDEIERNTAKEEWKKQEAEYARRREVMESKYQSHMNEWVDTIVGRVLSD